MKFLKLRGLFVELVERAFGRDVVDTGVDEVSKDADEDERADEDGMNHRPHDNTADSRADKGKGGCVVDELGEILSGASGGFDDFDAKVGEYAGEAKRNQVENPGKNATDENKREKTHTEDAAEVFR